TPCGGFDVVAHQDPPRSLRRWRAGDCRRCSIPATGEEIGRLARRAKSPGLLPGLFPIEWRTPALVLGFARLAHVGLGVKLQAKLIDEIELRLKEIDMAFLVTHQLLEQVARGIILH